MSKLDFKNSNEEHNFWQNHTDLMSGFLIVFIIASLIAYKQYMEKKDDYSKLIEMAGGSRTGELSDLELEQRLKELVSNAELYKKVSAFDSIQRALETEYYHYDAVNRRYECKVNVQFNRESSRIKPEYYSALDSAGQELVGILSQFPATNELGQNVGFKIVIDGRAAQPYNVKYPSQHDIEYADSLSYRRARNLYYLWRDSKIINQIENLGGEVFISGSGYGGTHRHTTETDPTSRDPEALNKRFILEIIPFIKF